MAELTCARMDVYHCIAGMIATILTAVYCPGRVGLHTPAPPGWLMGLFMVNIAGCYVYLGLTMWLCDARLAPGGDLCHSHVDKVCPSPYPGQLDARPCT